LEISIVVNKKQTIGFQIEKKGKEYVLRPFGIKDVEMMRHYKPNQRVLAHIEEGEKLGVSIPQFGLYWACCELVALNTEDRQWNTKEKVDLQARLGSGWIDKKKIVVLPDGTVHTPVKSLSHATINQFVFNNFMSLALDIMATKIGVTIEQLVYMAKQNMRTF